MGIDEGRQRLPLKTSEFLQEVFIMEKVCHLCGKQLTEEDEYQFFPEDDSCICKDCLFKTSKKEEKKEERD